MCIRDRWAVQPPRHRRAATGLSALRPGAPSPLRPQPLLNLFHLRGGAQEGRSEWPAALERGQGLLQRAAGPGPSKR
eukprot:11076786-Alexandrium_andersonii.AAC.1